MCDTHLCNQIFRLDCQYLIYNNMLMNKSILDLFRRKEVESNMDLICKHMEENGDIPEEQHGRRNTHRSIEVALTVLCTVK